MRNENKHIFVQLNDQKNDEQNEIEWKLKSLFGVVGGGSVGGSRSIINIIVWTIGCIHTHREKIKVTKSNLDLSIFFHNMLFFNNF